VARIFRENSIFFAAHDHEACPNPGLEAMACGCLVAGYGGTGNFPHPYATATNGIWVPDRTIGAAAEALRAAVQVVREGGEKCNQYLEAGRQTAERFTKQVVLQALRELLAVVGSQAYDARQFKLRGLGWRGKLYAYRLLYEYNRLGWSGQLLNLGSKLPKPLRKAITGPA
jgi:hypothetical protein